MVLGLVSYRDRDESPECTDPTTRLERATAWASINMWACVAVLYGFTSTMLWASGVATRVPRADLPEGSIQNHCGIVGLLALGPVTALIVAAASHGFEDSTFRRAAPRVALVLLWLHLAVLALASMLIELLAG